MAETVKSVEALWRKRQQQLNNPAPKRQRQQAPSSIELQLEIIRLEREASFLLRLAENLEKKTIRPRGPGDFGARAGGAMSDGLLRLRDEAFPLCQPAKIYENLVLGGSLMKIGLLLQNLHASP